MFYQKKKKKKFHVLALSTESGFPCTGGFLRIVGKILHTTLRRWNVGVDSMAEVNGSGSSLKVPCPCEWCYQSWPMWSESLHWTWLHTALLPLHASSSEIMSLGPPALFPSGSLTFGLQPTATCWYVRFLPSVPIFWASLSCTPEVPIIWCLLS